MTPFFGCRHDPDERDRLYAMADSPLPPTPVRKRWRIARTALDQGRTGTCVGHGWRNFLRCAPLRTERAGPSAWDIYRSAVKLDGYPDNDDEADLPDADPGLDSGTSVRAGAKAVLAFGRLKEYHWAHSLNAAVGWLLTQGPLVAGTIWTDGMMQPNDEGLVRVSGSEIGRHCWMIRGVDRKRRMIGPCCNSWGDAWGLSGEFFLTFEDLEGLLYSNGELCSAVEKLPG